MNNIVVYKDFEIHTTPLEILSIDPYCVNIELDDVSEKRFTIKASPYQAVRIVTIDCLSSMEYFNEYCFRDGIYHRHILEILESKWVEELRAGLADENAIFLDNAKHFVLPLQDIVIELIAENITVYTKI